MSIKLDSARQSSSESCIIHIEYVPPGRDLNSLDGILAQQQMIEEAQSALSARLRTFFQRPGATLSPPTRVPGMLLPDRPLAATYGPGPTMQSLQGGSRAIGGAMPPARSRAAPASGGAALGTEDGSGDDGADRNDEE